MITVSCYDWVPDFAKGHVRDLRVRWALEEAGMAYQSKPIDHVEKNSPEYRAWQPFSQVPAYDDGEIRMFESGAIVLRIAEQSEALMPADPKGRARTMMWLIAALNSIEPFVFGYSVAAVFNREAPWSAEARPVFEQMLKKKLADLSQWLQGREWLEDRFTAGDLMMACALRSVAERDFFKADPVLSAYYERCIARPAFQRALAAQMADFTGEAPQQAA